MLVLPELLVPKSPVIGAKRIASTDFQDLKFVKLSSVIMTLLLHLQQTLGLNILDRPSALASRMISGQLCTNPLYDKAKAARFLRSQMV